MTSYVRTVSCILSALGIGFALSPAPLTAGTTTNGLRIHTSHVTGKAAFVTEANGGSIPLDSNVAAGDTAARFVSQYGGLFGVTDAAKQFV